MMAFLKKGQLQPPYNGHQLFVKWFSSTTCNAPAKQEWREVFEGIFERSFWFVEKNLEGQSAGSVPFSRSKIKYTAESKGERQEASKGIFTKNELQISEDDDLLQDSRHLVKELNVDRAIALCAKLPANRLKAGIDTLVRVFLEGVCETKDQHELADKILDLLEQSKGKGCTPSEVTSHSLVKWIVDSGDALRAQRLLQLLQIPQHSNAPKAESMNFTEAEHFKDKMNRDSRKESDSVTRSSVPAKSHIVSAKELSRFLNEMNKSQITSDTQMTAIFQLLGISRYQENVLDNVELPRLKGVPNTDLSKLIDFYARGLTEVSCGSPRNIKRKVEGSKKINNLLLNFSTNTSFNRLIAYSANHGEIARCIELIQTMKSVGLQPCAASYEPLIAFFAGTLQISKAEDILQMMRNSGLHASKKAYECLIIAHTKSDNLERAFNLIEEIPLEELTPDLYNPIIHAYGKMGRVSLAVSVFRQMRLKNINPNTQNFASLIHACGIRKDLKGAEKVFTLFKKQNFAEESEELVLSAMMRVYAACGNDEQIEKVMSCTYANKLVRPEAKSLLLKSFAERGKIQKAIEIYNQIRNEGNWPDSGAFSSLLFNLGKAGELDQLLALFDPFKESIQTRNRVVQENLLSVACCTIVHAFIHHNQLEKALDFLQKIQVDNAGDVETLCLKVFTLDKCDNASVQHEHMTLKDKLEFLCAMRDRLKVHPTRLAYESLLESCAREKNLKCADRVLQMMKSDKLVLNVFTYLILLRVVVASGNLEALNLFLPKMRRAVENSGLQDNHVKLVVVEILKSANVNTSDLMCILYPSTDILI